MRKKTANERNIIEKSININCFQKYCNLIKIFESSNKTIDRKTFLMIAKKFNIVHKKDSITEIDEKIFMHSGRNANPKIIYINDLFFNMNISYRSINKLTRLISYEKYINNSKGYLV